MLSWCFDFIQWKIKSHENKNNKFLIFYNRFDYLIPIQVLFNIRSFNVLNNILMTIKKYIFVLHSISTYYIRLIIIAGLKERWQKFSAIKCKSDKLSTNAPILNFIRPDCDPNSVETLHRQEVSKNLTPKTGMVLNFLTCISHAPILQYLSRFIRD